MRPQRAVEGEVRAARAMGVEGGRHAFLIGSEGPGGSPDGGGEARDIGLREAGMLAVAVGAQGA